MAVADLPPPERAAYLDRECAGDPELRAEVDSILAHEGHTTAQFESPALSPRSPRSPGPGEPPRSPRPGESEGSPRSDDIAEARTAPLTPEPSPLIGQSFSHYRILSKLGEGGMGEVYLARDERLDREVALKVLLRGTLRDEAARRRLRKEALALSKLNHPNIATVFDFDSHEDVDFLVMEYVAGQGLEEKLSAGSLPEREVLRLGQQLAEGLSAAHGQGVIHRDLKPGNVRLTSDGRLKILDFGLAKQVARGSETATTESIAGAGSLVGTLPYMAPEQVRGEGVDERTDIWAAGLVLYELATGRRAFGQGHQASVIAAIVSAAPVAPSRVNARISAGLEGIIAKCLEKDPENRYQSAKELVVDLRRLAAPASGAGLEAARPARGRRRVVLAAAAAALAMVVVAGAVLIALDAGGVRGRLFSATPRIQSLAVLPLRNLTGDPQQEYFSDGMTDALINNLCKVAALRVISITSVMQYKNTQKSLTAIARELGVDAVVEGSVLRSGEQVRINAQLIQAGRERQMWAESYERDLRDVLKLQSEVASSISDAVRTSLTPEDQTRLAGARIVDPAAYEAYLLGQRYRSDWAAGLELEKSRDQFLRAIQLDPQFAAAYAGLASCYTQLALWSVLSPAEVTPLALEAADKAVQLDSTLAEAHMARGLVRLQLLWDWRGAETSYRHALALNPNSHDARNEYRFFLSCSGRMDEAVVLAEELLRDTPNSPSEMMNTAWTQFYARRYDDAIARLKSCLALEPESGDARVFLAASYAFKGLYPQALAECDILESRPESFDPFWIMMLGSIYAVSGRRDKALLALDRLQEREKLGYVDPAQYAYTYAGLGDKEQAFTYLDKAVEVRSTNVLQMSIEQIFDGLRSDPRFQELLSVVGPPGARL